MASALSSTAWIASWMSVLDTAMIASRSLMSARPMISWSDLKVSVTGFSWCRIERADHLGDDLLPGVGVGVGNAERLVEQEAEAHGVGEVDDRVGVEVRVDDARLLAGIEQLAQAAATGEELLAHHRL